MKTLVEKLLENETLRCFVVHDKEPHLQRVRKMLSSASTLHIRLDSIECALMRPYSVAVAYVGDKLVGAVSFAIESKDHLYGGDGKLVQDAPCKFVYISNLGSIESGAGRTLLNFVVEEAAELPVVVSATNSSRGFYRACGMREISKDIFISDFS